MAKTNYYLSSVYVTSNGSYVRGYQLSYSTSAKTSPSCVVVAAPGLLVDIMARGCRCGTLNREGA